MVEVFVSFKSNRFKDRGNSPHPLQITRYTVAIAAKVDSCFCRKAHVYSRIVRYNYSTPLSHEVHQALT